MATLVFNYNKEKVDKLDEIARKESRTRSNLIQKILMEFLDSRTKKTVKKKKKKLKVRKGAKNE